MEINYIDIGIRIKENRVKRGFTQEKLAEATDLSVSHISAIENAATKLALPTIVKIANVLDISVDELLCGSLLQGKAVVQNEFSELLADCTLFERSVIIDLAKATKKSLREKKEQES